MRGSPLPLRINLTSRHERPLPVSTIGPPVSPGQALSRQGQPQQDASPASPRLAWSRPASSSRASSSRSQASPALPRRGQPISRQTRLAEACPLEAGRACLAVPALVLSSVPSMPAASNLDLIVPRLGHVLINTQIAAPRFMFHLHRLSKN
jgi:hypothetical protein